jgi:hypothetical protein
MYWCQQADPEFDFTFAAHGGPQCWSHGASIPWLKICLRTAGHPLGGAIAPHVRAGSMMRRRTHSQTGVLPSVNVVKRLVQSA